MLNWNHGKGMSLRHASGHHRRTWQFPVSQPLSHEVSHLLLAMAGVKPYQGTWDAEVYNVVLDNYLIPQPDKPFTLKAFAQDITRASSDEVGAEQMRRTMQWLEGRKSGKTLAEIREDSGYDNPYFRNITSDDRRKCGIRKMEADIDPRTGVHHSWRITTTKGEVFSFNDKDESQIQLPEGSNGQDDFKPFQAPTPKAIKAVYNKVVGMVDFIRGEVGQNEAFADAQYQREIRRVKKDFGDINIRDVYEASRPKGRVGEREPDTSRVASKGGKAREE